MEKRYTITGKKPNNELVTIKNQTRNQILKIRDAMLFNGYYDLKLYRDPTPEELFIRGVMETRNCGPQAAMTIYKKIARVMAAEGVEFTRKEDLYATCN